MNRRAKNDDDLPNEKPKSFWEKLPWWTWLIVAIVGLGFISMVVIYIRGSIKTPFWQPKPAS